ncbi:cobalamin biosynthesis protein CobD/CbiB [Algibacillus agarilyticus]|uniref:cobalamin biosynthesis protein CobD/CbiB n=1 Tax=Algibacillus agarilyticus TaxID=2234133 RepID=UPI000DCFD474|nr:CobD/CbiB family cobalamin biosynthesis protein [Algibacillus agarilyticus]
MADVHFLTLFAPFALGITLLIALTLDYYLGEPKRFHYLVGFGYIASWFERHLNTKPNAPLDTPFLQKAETETLKRTLKNKLDTTSAMKGAIAWLLLVLPLPVLYLYFITPLAWYWQLPFDALVLYCALGLTSLNQHAMQVYLPLHNGDINTARHYTSYLVSRNTDALTAHEMSRATVESMLENGHDAVIASLFYFVIGGAPLVIVHRLANTLDAMWGYKNARYRSFGYAAARLDDALGFASGKCCTLLYSLQGTFRLCLKNAFIQGNQYKSHNGGWVMAAGATAMQRTLGGSAIYHGKTHLSPTLGGGKPIEVNDIPASVKIVKQASVIFITVVIFSQALWVLFNLNAGQAG